MNQALDYFFGPYVPPQSQRHRAVSQNGVQHASEIEPRDPLPDQPVTLFISTDAMLPIDRVAVYFTNDGALPEGKSGEATTGHVVLAALVAKGDGTAEGVRTCGWQARLPGQPDGTLVRYRIDGWNSGDPSRRWPADASDPFAAPAPNGREFAYHVDRRRPPEWVRDAIVYHIFVDRFAAASDQPPVRDPGSITGFYGGTIRGVLERLDYVADLGFNCLWLSPVMESPTYHGYNPSSYREVAKRLGTNDDLRALIATAHARGLRVLLDFVANHTSNEHPAFLAAQREPGSPSAGWYTLGEAYKNGYLTFYDVKSMPVLATDTQPVREYLIEEARYWLGELGADGLRLDNVSGPAHAFWTFFQEGIKSAFPDALTIGEITGGMSDLLTYAGRMDACMDFPLTRMIRRAFAQRDATLDDLLATLAAQEAALPPTMAAARLLDNHDMHRFLWLAENDTRRLKLAMAFLVMLPGPLIVYYGTEVGLSQRAGPPGQDAYAREPMLWGADQQADVREQVRWLIQQRGQRASLRRGQLARVPVRLAAGDAHQVGALLRWTDDEATLIVLNNAETPAGFDLAGTDLPTPWAERDPTATWLLTPDGISPQQSSGLSGSLPPLSAMLIMWR
jgi:cyclomaltodextrinase